MKWYVINTKPRQEKIAELNLQRLEIETFVPLLKQNKLIRRKRREVVGPLFPGYLFSQFSINTHYRAVHYAQGVRGVVAFGDVPAEMDEESIIFIKSRIINDFVDMDQLHFSHGQTVRICEGPFQGLEAIFEREITSQQRVVLLLNALAQKTPVVVDREYVTVV